MSPVEVIAVPLVPLFWGVQFVTTKVGVAAIPPMLFGALRFAVITGTSSGFGRLMTASLLARGDRVAATLRKVEALDDLKVRHSERLWVARLDVTDATAIRRVVDQAFGDLGRIDVVVINAAYGLVGAAEELTDDQIRQQVDPTSSARSGSSARRCRTCVRRAAAASCRCRPKAARSAIPPSASITLPSEGLRVLWKRLPFP